MLSTAKQSTAGVTIVECLVALVLLSVGLLSATGTVGAAGRLMRNGDASATAARQLVSVADSLRGAVALAGGSCTALAAGTTAARGVTVSWSAAPVPPGSADVELTVSYAGRTHRDTVLTRIACQ